MKIIPLAHQAIRKLALIGLLFSPFMLVPSHAAELVGKPIAAGTQSAVTASATNTSVQAQDAKAQADAAASVAPIPDLPEPPNDSPKENIKRALEDVRDNFHHEMPDDFGGFSLDPETLIPITAMLLLFGGPILLVIVLAILHYRSKALRQKNININIDKLLAAGRDIPVELLLGEETAVKRSVSGDLVTYTTSDGMMQKGIRNIGLGTGWLLFLTIMFNIEIGSFGFIFIGLGISQVVIWVLSDKKEKQIVKAQD